jgi:flagellar FliL protein
MAEQENIDKSTSPEPQAQESPGPLMKVLPWLAPALVVIVCAAVGFLVGRLFGTRGPAQTVSGAEQSSPADSGRSKEPALKPSAGGTWFYDLEPVVVNLNEPGVTRYVRIGLTLEVGSTMEEKEGKVFLDQKKPLMKHWLTLFLSNQTLENTRGERNLTRMQTQISDTLNNGLFPVGKPRIKSVLFKEFAIQ